MRGRLGEPVLHLLLIGLVIFLAHGLLAERGHDGQRIVVSQAAVDALAREHRARWMRPPTERQLAGLVDALVRDEVLYREGAPA